MEVSNLRDRLESYTKIISLFLLICYIIGFFIWNFFLYSLRFNEIEILQTRFIYTGFSFVFLFGLLILIVCALYEFIKGFIFTIVWRDRFIKFLSFKIIKKGIAPLLIILFLFFSLSFYSLFIFPKLPRIFGGGRPLSLSLITQKSNTPLSLDELSVFGIPKGEGSDIQTANLCVAYENAHFIVVLLGNRVIHFDRSKLIGLGVIPDSTIHEQEKNACTSLAAFWLMRGFGLENNKLTQLIFGAFYDMPIVLPLKQ